jgi:hypothetical protein
LESPIDWIAEAKRCEGIKPKPVKYYYDQVSDRADPCRQHENETDAAPATEPEIAVSLNAFRFLPHAGHPDAHGTYSQEQVNVPCFHLLFNRLGF